jgi:hypothetical protein
MPAAAASLAPPCVSGWGLDAPFALESACVPARSNVTEHYAFIARQIDSILKILSLASLQAPLAGAAFILIFAWFNFSSLTVQYPCRIPAGSLPEALTSFETCFPQDPEPAKPLSRRSSIAYPPCRAFLATRIFF